MNNFRVVKAETRKAADMGNAPKVVDKENLLDRHIMAHFPKVELHRHLEGTFDIPTLHRIALKNKLDVPASLIEFKSKAQFPRDGKSDFLLFLSKFRNDWYRSMDDIYELSFNSISKLKSEGIFYIELRFSPDGFSLFNNFDRVLATKTVIEAGNKAAQETGLNIKYLITFTRSKQSLEEMISMYKKIRDINEPSIVGMDLAGDETNYPPEQFKKLMDLIHKDNQYCITVHAGEVSPSSQIWTSINELHAKRIGHGTSTISDGKLQTELAKRKIALEQCITSNFQTGSWQDEPNHPLGRLFKSGVPVTINSDDPTIQDSDLTDDYIKTVRYFDFNVEDLRKINHIALNCSFVDEHAKSNLIKLYDEQVQAFIERFGS